MNRLHFISIPSTHRWAMDNAANLNQMGLVTDDHWLAITTNEQTAGIGSRSFRDNYSRIWVSMKGDILLTVIAPLRPTEPKLLPLAVGLAAAETLESFGVPKVQLKWVNDIWIAHNNDANDWRKVGGSLCADLGIQTISGSSLYLLSIGINGPRRVDTEFQLTTLEESLGPNMPPWDTLLEPLLDNIHKYSLMGCGTHTENVVAGVRNRLALKGRDVILDLDTSEIEGRVVDLGNDGSLLIERDNDKRIEPHYFGRLRRKEF